MNFYEFQTKQTQTDGVTANGTLGILWDERGKGTEYYNTTSKCSSIISHAYAVSLF
jgi:hypothetical protein